MTAAIAKRIGLLGGPVLARHFTCLFAVVVVAVMGTAYAAGPLRAEPESLERAAPELIERLRADLTIISDSSTAVDRAGLRRFGQ
jgi:hypothetical protein